MVAHSVSTLGLDTEYFDYAKGILKTSYYNYKKGLVNNRGKLLFQWQDNTLEVDVVNLQMVETYSQKWVDTYPDPLFPKEKQIKAEVAEGIRLLHQEPAAKEKALDAFANNIRFHQVFYYNASQLAGKIWFDRFLKGREVSWKLPLANVQEGKGTGYAYQEDYEVTWENKTLQVVRHTNDDSHVFSNTGSWVEVKAACQEVKAGEDGTWLLILEDKE